MTDPQSSSDEMEGQEEQITNEGIWTRETFNKVRADFLKARDAGSETEALNVLQQLAAIDAENVEEDAWLDCRDVIDVVLNTIPTKFLLLNQQILLLRAIGGAPSHIVSFLATSFSKNPEAVHYLTNEAVAVAVAFARRINDLDTFEAIAELLGPMTRRTEIVTELMHQLDNNEGSEHRFRVYQVLLVSIRTNAYNPSMNPIFEKIVEEISGNDILSQLAAMDFLSDIAVAGKHGAQLLNERGIPQAIAAKLRACQDSPDGGFLYSACTKFLGSLCRCYPEMIEILPDFMPSVINMMLCHSVLDASQRVLAVETFANVALTSTGKGYILKKIGIEALKATLKALSDGMKSGPTELRVRALESWTTMMETCDNETLESWLQMNDDIVDIVSTYVCRPFPELRLAAIKALALLLAHEAGARRVLAARAGSEEFEKWLVNPQSEAEWQCNQEKSAMIKALRVSNYTFLTNDLKSKIRSYFDRPGGLPNVATLEL